MIILETKGGGLGDEICSEPVVRYACQKLYPPDEDIRICTAFPEIFKHLSKRCGANASELGVSAGDKFLHLSSSPYKFVEGKHYTHPFASIAQPLFVPTIEFHSMFMLRRTLPDADKRIFLGLNPVSVSKISNILGSNEAPVALVHGASTDETRMLPVDYCAELIHGLNELGFKTILFGRCERNYNECRPSLNLINQLDVDDTVALVATSPLLITNDSAPVHIAAAFDNYLVVLPTIRHPDRLVHPRHGSRYWRTAAFYQKLMVDDKNWRPEVDIEFWQWSPDIPNKRDFLAPIDQILGYAKSAIVVNNM